MNVDTCKKSYLIFPTLYETQWTLTIVELKLLTGLMTSDMEVKYLYIDSRLSLDTINEYTKQKDFIITKVKEIMELLIRKFRYLSINLSIPVIRPLKPTNKNDFCAYLDIQELKFMSAYHCIVYLNGFFSFFEKDVEKNKNKTKTYSTLYAQLVIKYYFNSSALIKKRSINNLEVLTLKVLFSLIVVMFY